MGIALVLLAGPAVEARCACDEKDDELAEPVWEMTDEGGEREYGRASRPNVGIEPALFDGPVKDPGARWACEDVVAEIEPLCEMIDDGCEREYGPTSTLKVLGECDRLDSEDNMDGLLEKAGPARGEERNGREAWTDVG